jgi:hypothetical protein
VGEGSLAPFDYSTESLLREKATACAQLRELLAAVAGDLERLAAEYPGLASRFLARAQRLRLHQGGSATPADRSAPDGTMRAP